MRHLVRKPLLWGLILALLAFLLTGRISESGRLWKELQRDFLSLERQRLSEQLAVERQRADEATTVLLTELAVRQQAATGKEDEHARLADELAGLRRRSKVARSRLAGLRQELDAERDELRMTRLELESLSELEAGLELELAELERPVRELEERLAGEQAMVRELERRLRALDSDARLAPRETDVSAWPLATPWGPAKRVDRCVTCHLAVEREDGADSEAPFDAHPRLDLFVARDSPHPYDRFGCTPCHGGEGRALGFSRAGHRPGNVEQEALWAERWGFRSVDLPRDPILSDDLVEARCASCHADGAWLPGAARFNRGLELVRVLGCRGCHAPTEDDQPGPSLERLAAKTEPGWAYHWLAAPRDFRATTAMPHLFELGGTVSEPERRRRQAEMRAIVMYLWERSEPWQVLYRAIPDGDEAVGEQLFGTLGCDGCHLLSAGPLPRQTFLGELERLHGPNLARTGNKVDGSWLYNWLRDPKAYQATTPMPDLRLSELEAAHLTAFLLAQRDPSWDDRELPAIDAEARDELVLAHLERELTLEGSLARLEGMDEVERELYLGERSIARYGCSSCHRIPGLDAEQPGVGGQRPWSVDMPRVPPDITRPDWLRRHLHHPKSAPPGSVEPLAEGEPLPDYGLRDAEVEHLLPALLSLSLDTSGQAGMVEALEARDEVLEKGRQAVARLNCRGCHRLEGHGGAPSTWSASPPDLDHEGRRVKPRWLQSYLEDPSRWPLRPGLTARMPSFALSDEEIAVLVAYFAALDRTSLLISDPPFSARDAAVGEIAFGLLQCGRCHQGAEVGTDRLSPPPYELAHQRLRPEWVVDWILDPKAVLPDTPMSQILAREMEDRSDAFLAAAVGAPMFWQERSRLRRLFTSEEEMLAVLSDPEQVAQALRAYLWTLAAPAS